MRQDGPRERLENEIARNAVEAAIDWGVQRKQIASDLGIEYGLFLRWMRGERVSVLEERKIVEELAEKWREEQERALRIFLSNPREVAEKAGVKWSTAVGWRNKQKVPRVHIEKVLVLEGEVEPAIFRRGSFDGAWGRKAATARWGEAGPWQVRIMLHILHNPDRAYLYAMKEELEVTSKVTIAVSLLKKKGFVEVKRLEGAKVKGVPKRKIYGLTEEGLRVLREMGVWGAEAKREGAKG